ncbi:MAG: 6-phosphogluconolactonase [bacterium]
MNYFTFPDEAAWLDALADQWQQTSGQAIHRRGSFKAALCGQPLFLPFYRRLARLDTAWSAMRFFIVNEQCVSPKHRNSHYRAIFEAFYPHRIHLERWKTEIGKPEAVAADYERRLKVELSDPPRLDLAILDVSETASSPPALLADEAEEISPLATSQSGRQSSSSSRLALTLHLLKQARALWLFARAPLTLAQIENTLADASSPLGALVKEREASVILKKTGEANADAVFYCAEATDAQ